MLASHTSLQCSSWTAAGASPAVDSTLGAGAIGVAASGGAGICTSTAVIVAVIAFILSVLVLMEWPPRVASEYELALPLLLPPWSLLLPLVPPPPS